MSSSQSGLMHAGQPCCTVLHCSVSTTFFTLDTCGIDCCTMKQVCFVIYIICCSRCAVCSLVMGWVHVELCWHTVHWTDLLSFTYSAPVRTVSGTCHLVFALKQSTAWRQNDCGQILVETYLLTQVYEPECLVTLLPSSICLLTNHFTLFQHERDESP